MSIQVTTLKNGLRVVTDTIPHVETASLGIWVKAGTRNETQDINGVAHFLEHMAFKGTERHTAKDIAEKIEAVGGYLNAYTSREITAYYARVLKKDTALALDILMDILHHSTFVEEELDKEREVIIQEIGQSQDTPDDVIFDYFQELGYPDQPMGWTTLGPASTIKTMKREALIRFMREHYDPRHMVVAAAGNVDHETILKQVEDLFHLPHVPNLEIPLKGTYKGGRLIQKKDLEQLHILYGFEGVSFKTDLFYTASLYSVIMGGGMASRLFQEIREKRGLVYTIYAFSSPYQDTGLFGFYAGTSKEEGKHLMNVLGVELEKSTHTLTAPELERAKNQIKSSILMGLESTSGRSRQAAQHLLMDDRIIPMEEIMTKIDAVTLSHVHGFAEQLLKGPSIFTALGPTDVLKDFHLHE